MKATVNVEWHRFPSIKYYCRKFKLPNIFKMPYKGGRYIFYQNISPEKIENSYKNNICCRGLLNPEI